MKYPPKTKLEIRKRLQMDPTAYGGDLYRTRKGRARPRPISQKHSMHLVLRAECAQGEWSFKRHRNRVEQIIKKFAFKHSIYIHSQAIHGNHLHFHVHVKQHSNTYKRFIRALTAAITMAITNASRFNKLKKKFWDDRPYTRLARSQEAFDRVEHYVRINQIEANGCNRADARFYADWEKAEKEDRKRWLSSSA